MVLPQLSEAQRAGIWDYNSILKQLSRVYDNPNKVQEAEDRLLSLKQGTDSIPAFIAKFERVLFEARGQAWQDVNKISSFRNGLNSTIRGRLAQQLNLPRNYPAFVKVVQQLAGRSLSGYPTTSVPSSTPQSYSLNRHDKIDTSIGNLEINTVSLGLAPSVPKTILQRPTTQKALFVSVQKRQEYRQTGKCVRCGSDSHWVSDCKLQAYGQTYDPRKKDYYAPHPISGKYSAEGASYWDRRIRENEERKAVIAALEADSDSDSNSEADYNEEESGSERYYVDGES
jgi:hypothetical protein